MQTLIDLLLEYWIVPVGAGLLFGPSAYSYLKQKLSVIKLPTFKKSIPVQNIDDVVDKDLEAIHWLAKRAVEMGDTSLVE